jgi:type I restriction enzyme R subunit
MCKKYPDYVVRITGSDAYGQSKLDYFISVSSKTPVIATTSKLLSTGVDCKMVKLIALDQRINSMTEFKQIVGRGTRIREKEGKTHFTIMDFRNITRLFADPDWDGPLEVDKGYLPDRAKPYEPPKDKPDDGGIMAHEGIPFVDKNGCEVKIINKVVSVYDSNGKLLRTENITDYTKKNINDTYTNLNDFINHWNEAERKAEITELMRESGIDLQALKHDQGMDDVDDFDFICHIAYGKKPLTRKERAENVKKRDVFHKYGPEAQKVLEALLDKYMNEGISQLENRKVLTLDPFRQMGSPSGIAKLFGGNQQYMAAVKELEDSIYNDIA